ncbi:MAG: hypothetical protein JO023_14995 [Chloroflexi bacterium]|nr:hypothetical protein [Chloroflexota bacterium]
MSPFPSTRLAWGIALASLALWAVSAPAAFGQLGSAWSATSDLTGDASTTADSTGDGTTSIQPDPQGAPCPTQPSAVSESAPPAATSVPPDATQATFRLCGPDAGVERSIEQLVAGRPFTTSLTSRNDGCADLLVQVTAPDAVVSGHSSTSVSVGVGAGQRLTVQIDSENGATHAHIG